MRQYACNMISFTSKGRLADKVAQHTDHESWPNWILCCKCYISVIKQIWQNTYISYESTFEIQDSKFQIQYLIFEIQCP